MQPITQTVAGLCPTDTPTPTPVYLPLLLRENCVPEIRRVDVILAIDASTSMTEQVAAGGTKLDAAIAAARVFLDALRFDRGDQAAIVAFNTEATLLAPLTGDRAALDAALAGIQPAQQTCLVCAVQTSAAELASPRHLAAHLPTLILLTDGRSNPQPVSEAVARAAEAKAAGVMIYTIGLGAEVEAVALPCPAGAFWGGR
jgi:Ca-activated chloride channel family protein